MSLPHLYARVPLIFAHRGASAYAPENTLAAFRRAVELGAEGVELDVTLSADGVPVVIHDDTLDRTTDGRGAVARATLAQLKQLDAGFRARFGDQFAGERLPSLAEVFVAVPPPVILNVELKRDASPDKTLAERVVALIREHRMEARVLLSSFYYDNLQRVKRVDPALPVGLLYAPGLAAYIVRSGLPPIVPHEAHHPHRSLVNAGAMRWYRGRGYRVNVWTVNEAAEMRRLMGLGVDGFFTDVPDVAVRVREEWSRPPAES